MAPSSQKLKPPQNPGRFTKTNEFALYNNGITMLSEETNINEKIGQKNKAQLRIKNPQIINGGQTSFTLSRILEENRDNAAELFDDKEVLLKIITLLDNDSQQAKLELIDQISNATNKQTPVINADRFANEAFHIAVQRKVFERYGLLYERKRGEFSAGLKDGYIEAKKIVERNHYWRVYYAANGETEKGFQRRLFQKNKFPGVDIEKNSSFDRTFLGLTVFERLRRNVRRGAPMDRDIYAKVFMYVELFYQEGTLNWANEVDSMMTTFQSVWNQFIERQRQKTGPKQRAYIDKETGEARIKLTEPKYYYNPSLKGELSRYILEARVNVPQQSTTGTTPRNSTGKLAAR